MTGDPTHPTPAGRPLAVEFPTPGPAVQRAYHHLWVARLDAHQLADQPGLLAEQQKLGDPTLLPRPWDPPTCTDRSLRWQLWLWLDAVVDWVNTEYVWDPNGAPTIPDCWPQHPHLVHELAVLADQRRRCSLATESDLLENWHRFVLPGFIDRLRHRLRQCCEDGVHQPWPAAGRYVRSTSDRAVAQRRTLFEHDLNRPAPTDPDPDPDLGWPALVLVTDDGDLIDPATGETLTPLGDRHR